MSLAAQAKEDSESGEDGSEWFSDGLDDEHESEFELSGKLN